MEPRVRNGKLVQKLIFAAIAAIVGIAVVLTVISGVEINRTYSSMVEEELRVAVEQLNNEMSNVWDGDWSLADGSVYKGEENIMAEYEEIMDELKSRTGMEYSLVYGKTRMITTLKTKSGQKATGFDISDTVADQVLGKKQMMYMKSIPAGVDENFYCYYSPLLNEDGSAIGMVYAGRESDSVAATIRSIILQMVLISTLLTIALSIVGIVVCIVSGIVIFLKKKNTA